MIFVDVQDIVVFMRVDDYCSLGKDDYILIET